MIRTLVSALGRARLPRAAWPGLLLHAAAYGLPLLANAVQPEPLSASTNVIQGIDSGWHAPGYVPDELLVKFKDGVSAAQVMSAIRRTGAALRRTLTPDGLVQVDLPPGLSVPDAIDRWSQSTEVEYAAPNLYASAFFVPNDSVIGTFDLAWNLRHVGALDAWDVVTGHPGVVLAIVDTGVAFEDHPVPIYEASFIKPGVTTYRQSPELNGPFLPGYDFVNEDDHPNDDSGHGTMVATIAAGQADNRAGSAGIAFGITILPVKVLNFRGEGTMATVVSGIRYAADQRADIMNLSLGFPPLRQLRDRGVPEKILASTFHPLKDAIAYAQRRGSIVVAAAGNFHYPELSLPAGCAGVISVAATGFNDSLASYASFGNGLSFVAPGGDFTELNGDHVQDLIPNLSIKPFRSEGSLANPDSFNVFYFFGTSAAAPHVSGAVALLKSLGVKDQGEIEQALRATAAHPFSKPNAYDPMYGYGLIQIDKAVRYAAQKPSLRHARTKGDAFGTRLLSENPARDAAVLSLRMVRYGRVRVRLFDIAGRLVRTVADGSFEPGERIVRWDGRDDRGRIVGNGVYFFRIEIGDRLLTRRVAVLH